MTVKEVEKKYETKLEKVSNSVWSDGYLHYTTTDPDIVEEYVDFMNDLIKIKKSGNLEAFRMMNADDAVLCKFIDAIAEDEINDIQIIEKGDDFVVFTDTTTKLHK